MSNKLEKKISVKNYSLSSLGTFTEEKLGELKNAKHNDPMTLKTWCIDSN